MEPLQPGACASLALIMERGRRLIGKCELEVSLNNLWKIMKPRNSQNCLVESFFGNKIPIAFILPFGKSCH